MTEADINEERYLWSGESVFCKCGHHVEFQKSAERILSVFCENRPYGYCCFKVKDNGKDSGDEDIECECQEFVPYKTKKQGIKHSLTSQQELNRAFTD